MDYISLIISFVALIVSAMSFYVARKAFTFSLFERRYEFYFRFMVLINKIITLDKNLFDECLNETKFLLWEAKYIYGDEIGQLLESIKEALVACKTCSSQESDQLRERYIKNSKTLADITVELMEGKTNNLDAYFHKYLFDNQFKEPIRCL